MFKSSLIYLVSSVFNKLVPFILLPFLTSYLTPEEFGSLSIFQVLMSLAIALLGNVPVGIPNAYVKLNKLNFGRYILASLMGLLIFLLFSVALFSVYILADGDDFGVNPAFFLSIPVYAAFNMITLMALTICRSQERPLLYMALEVGQAVINITLSLLLILLVDASWESRGLGIVIPMVIFGVFSLIYFLRRRSGDGSLLYLPEVVKTCVPMVPHALSAVVIMASDKLILGALLGEGAVGIYSVGYQFGMVLMLFSEAFIKSWQPRFFRSVDSNNWKYIKKIELMYLMVFPVFAAFYTLVATIILPYVVSEAYRDAVLVIPYVAIGYVFYAYYQLYFSYLLLLNKTGMLMVLSPVGAAINVAGNYVLIEEYGMVGAAYSTVLSFMFTSLVLSIFVRMKVNYV